MNDEWMSPPPDPGTPVRQGDLLLRRNPTTGEVLRVCLVITADCDIAQGKFGNELAALIVIPFHTYIRETWSERRLQTAVDKAATKLCSIVNKWNAARLGGGDSLITQEALTNWVRREDGSAIAERLKVPDGDRKKLVSEFDKFRNAVLAIDGCSEDALEKLTAFRSSMEQRPRDAVLVDLIGSVTRKELPADVFLLPNVPQVGFEAAVILLREIVGVAFEKVCFRTVDAASDQHYLRVGRLEPTFKYGVSQSFGTLYSRIGLPHDHEERCEEAIEYLTAVKWGYK